MFERFTDRARKVMALANQEAQRFNHEYIGTEHILLGLVKEGSGVGANVLKNLDVDLRKVRLEVEKLVKRSTSRSASSPSTRSEPERDPNVAAAEDSLQRAIGTKVRIVQSGKGGKIELHFYSHEELERVYQMVMAAARGGRRHGSRARTPGSRRTRTSRRRRP